MKNYFGFNLTAKKLLPIWLIFYFLFITSYVVLINSMKNIQSGTTPSGMLFLFLFLLFLVAFFISFYIAKIIIENFTYKDKPIIFNGKFGKFVGLILVGLLLSIITLGVYMAWFIRNIHRFFVNNSVYENESFTFQGKGGRLFVIVLLTIFLPIIALTIIMSKVFMVNPEHVSISNMIFQQIISWMIMIPYIYFIYKWMVNIDYKNYNIRWETEFWNSCGKLALEIFLSVITIGIYSPMAVIKLYAYFTERTIVQSGDVKRKFGFDTDNINDFLFIWGQILLTIITLGIYYPWSISKIGKKILSRTYLE
ncbi:MAG: hypothetical protein CVU06_12835 [Bacteroidetes bacterium HGW-Bacteroidetes-22]|nr:MAG: hypothetical protein CVU06_12835 [Bacteroidetes bacterium HGW-Bacteroidetes-22]